VGVAVLNVEDGVEVVVTAPGAATDRVLEEHLPPVWSRDGLTLYFDGRHGDAPSGPQLLSYVYAASADGKERPRLLTSGYCASISADGGTLYIHDDKIYAVRLGSMPLERKPLARGMDPRISPSGEMVAFHYWDMADPEVSGLFCQRLADGRIERLWPTLVTHYGWLSGSSHIRKKEGTPSGAGRP
jgi:hypothetical protein